MNKLSRALVALATTGALVVLAAPTAYASRPSEPAVDLGEVVSAILHNGPGDAAYWTPARMRKAKPAETLARRAYDRQRKAGLLDGLGDLTGKPFSLPSTKAAAPGVAPVGHVGKVFFTFGGVDYVCSGNVVSSRNQDVVATAGHCVNEGPGRYASNWTFVPAYDDGDAPYGKWTARKLFTTSQWAKKGDLNFDTGFAVLGTRGGRHVGAVVGASGVAFNQAKGQTYTLYGYPADQPFDGEKLQKCTGKAVKDAYGSADQGVTCDMTGGSSGGPWLLGNGSRGTQQSVNSFGYDSEPDKMYGPYWGSAIQGSYNSASAA